MIDLDIKQLNAFITIAKLSSFTQAANQLGYAQSSVTSQIQLIEKELGYRLFERFGKKITLTVEGKEFLLYANQMVNMWEKAQNIATDSSNAKGPIIIGAVESICSFRLPKLLKAFSNSYPNVEIIIKTANSLGLQTLLIENQIDIAILLDTEISHAEFDIKYKQSEPVSLFASPDHPLAGKTSVYSEDLLKYPLLLTRKGCFYRSLFDKILKNEKITSKITLETSNIHMIKQLAILNYGITLLPKFTIIEELKSNTLTELCWSGEDFNIMTQIVCHKDKWISPSMNAFITLIQNSGI